MLFLQSGFLRKYRRIHKWVENFWQKIKPCISENDRFSGALVECQSRALYCILNKSAAR